MNLDKQDIQQQIKELAPYLMVGGVGAGLGALATGRRRKRRGEGRAGYTGRILRNAALAATLAGGGSWAAKQGLDRLTGSGVTDDIPQPSPGRDAARGITANPLVVGGTGLATVAGIHKLSPGGKTSDVLSQLATKLSASDTKDAAGNVIKGVPVLPEELKSMHRTNRQGFINKLVGATPEETRQLRDMANRSGLSLHEKGVKDVFKSVSPTNNQGNLKKGVKSILGRDFKKGLGEVRQAFNKPTLAGTKARVGQATGGLHGTGSRIARGSKIFGQTRGSMARRLAAGTLAGLAPAVVTSVMTQGND